MSVWLRFAAASTLVAVTAVAAPALAQSDAERAEALNTEGKELFKEEDYEAALDRFERAVELNPDPRFHFNICFTLYMLRDLHAAASACDEVQPPQADEDLIKKRDHVMGLIDEEMEKQDEAPAPDGGDPGSGGTGEEVDYDSEPGGDSRRPGPPPELPSEPEIPHNYNWSVGGQVGLLGNLGLGGDNFAPAGPHLRLHANFILAPAYRFGAQGYVNFAQFGPAATAEPGVRSLGIADIGGALYQHIPLSGGLYFTPLGGIHLSIQQPAGSELAFGTLGVRADASLNYIFGARDQHALTVTPVGLNLYLPSSDASTSLSAADYGLNRGSATYAFTVGYSMRFAEPFGGSLITLE